MLRLKNRPFFILAAALGLITLTTPVMASTENVARSFPIQHNGRVKAFDSFCRQTVQTITGRERWHKKDSVTAVLEAIGLGEALSDLAWVHINSAELRTALDLDAKETFFSYNTLLPVFPKIEAFMESAKEKRDQEKSTSHVERETETLYASLVTVKQLITGETLRVIPPVDGSSEEWLSPYQTIDERAPEFKELVSLFSQNNAAEFSKHAVEWNEKVDQVTGEKYRRTVQLELLYSGFRPFQWSWIAYLAGFILLATLKKKKFWNISGVGLVITGLLCHTLGLVLRVLILERPPVSNMYESMVYMNWAAMVFALCFAIGTRKVIYLTAGSAISALIMIYGNLLPIDANLEVLVPVLRSNYWLTIHVMTIVSSYGAFGLAAALGHRHLIVELMKRSSKAVQEESALLIYRVIQLGVLLLGIGTVLGGVWANESWGRFWGWDPKETWALITFLAYLVVVHLKFSKKIDAHWLAVSSILGFFFVLMTWYGVNFVLGRGLHSYGFGAGGMDWIVYYLVAENSFLVFVMGREFKRRAS